MGERSAERGEKGKIADPSLPAKESGQQKQDKKEMLLTNS